MTTFIELCIILAAALCAFTAVAWFTMRSPLCIVAALAAALLGWLWVAYRKVDQ